MANDSLELSLKIKSAVEGLGEVSKLADEIEQLGGDAAEVRQKAGALAEQLAKLGEQQALIDDFSRLAGATRTASEALEKSRQNTKALADQLGQSQANVQSISTALDGAKRALAGAFSADEAKALKGEVKALEAQLRAAEKESGALEAAFHGSRAATLQWADTTKDQLKKLEQAGQAMRDAGLDAGQLGKAQAQVASGMQAAEQAAKDLDAALAPLRAQAEAAAQVDMARGILDVKPHKAVEAEIQKVKDAFQALRQSGTASQAEIAQAALKAEERIRELQRSTNGWADALAKSKDAFIAAGAAGAGLYAASKQAIEYESALASIAKTTGMDAQQTAQLGDRLKELATQLPINADGLAKIAAAGGQLGISNSQIETFVGLVAKISSAFDIPVEQASEAVAALANNFGLSIEQVGALGDTINVLGNKTAASEKDIVDALTRIGGTAKQFGLTAEQAAGLADAMLSLKMPAEVAGTAINALLSKLQTGREGSKDFQEGLQRLGLSADQMANQVAANPQQALSTFLHTLEKLDAQTRAELLTKLFGEEHQDEIGRLVGALGQFDAAMGIVADKTGAAGAMQQEFEAKLKTTEAQLQLMKNAVEAAAINLGSVFLPSIREVAGGAKDAAKAIADFEAAFPGLAGLAASLATTAASVGALRLALLALGVVGAQAFDWTKGLGPKLGADLASAEAGVGKLQIAMAGLSAYIVGWNIGTYLRDKFETFRVAGVAAVEGVAKAVEFLRYSYEAYQALFSSDTLAAVEERHAQRLREMGGIFQQMYADAKHGADQAAQGAQNAADKTQGLGQAGQKAGNDLAAGLGQAKGSTDQFSAALDEAAKSADGGGKKLGELIAQYDLLKPDHADQLALAIGRLGDGSEGAAKAVRDELVAAFEKLSGPALQAEVAALRAKLQDVGVASGQLATAVDAGVRAQFKALGLDADQAMTGISAKVRDDVAALDGLAQAGALTGRALKDGLSNLVNQATTTAELREITGKIAELGRTGALSFKELKDAYAQVAEAQRKIGVSASELREAQDRARISADQLAQAHRTGAETEELIARSAKDAAEALRLQTAAQEDSKAAISKQADALTQAEKAQSADLLARQRAEQATRRQTEAVDENSQASSRWYSIMEVALNTIRQHSEALYRAIAVDQAWQTTVEEQGKQIAWATNLINEQLAAIDHMSTALQQAQGPGGDLASTMHKLGFSLADNANAADEVRSRFRDLNDAELTGLISQVEAAQNKIRGFRDSARADLDNVLNQLDQLNGNEAAIEERRYQQQKADFEAKLALAQQMGDAQSQAMYQQALNKLDELHRANQRNLKGKAEGGPVKGGEEIVVGERGPEIYISKDGSQAVEVGTDGPGKWTPPGDGEIIPAGQTEAYFARIKLDYDNQARAKAARDAEYARLGIARDMTQRAESDKFYHQAWERQHWAEKAQAAALAAHDAASQAYREAEASRPPADYTNRANAPKPAAAKPDPEANPMGRDGWGGWSTRPDLVTPAAASAAPVQIVRHIIEQAGQNAATIDTTQATSDTLTSLIDRLAHEARTA